MFKRRRNRMGEKKREGGGGEAKTEGETGGGR